uniref:Calponin-homology (CH) domain-containing protein n=1 Tax=Heterorhabditis bacteriophora TaxID=37862 RepID=A0A1I7WMM0_HETBA
MDLSYGMFKVPVIFYHNYYLSVVQRRIATNFCYRCFPYPYRVFQVAICVPYGQNKCRTILNKLINLAVPGTIDERAINKKNLNTYTKLENLTLALMSAQVILFLHSFIVKILSEAFLLILLSVEDVIEETREEKTYKNWMNSMGVNPYVNWLYSDLQNGVIIFQLYDIIRPGIVVWKRVVRIFHKLRGMMDQIQNCNYAVELGRQLRFSLVGIQGKDIYDGNQTLTLGAFLIRQLCSLLTLVWQLMRAYTLTVLAQCTQSGDALPSDKDIVAWVNQKLLSSGKTSSIRSFQDTSISDARVVLDLIDAIKPNVIDQSVVKSGGSVENNMENAKYAITCGRKIGAKIYALPEDIVEVKPKMVMTVFACLMARDYMPDMREAAAPIAPLE